jgi:hypothetical protein
MSLLDRYERQATILPLRAAGAREDLVARAVDDGRTWREIDQAIREGGDPMALVGGIAGLELTPPIVNETLVTGTATEQAIWPTARTAIAAAPRAPVMYVVWASGTSTTAATPGTYTLSARVGTANTAPLIGATSGALTPVASATAAQWTCHGWVYVRGGDTTGTAQSSLTFLHSATTGGGGPVTATGNAVVGGISAAVDFSAASALWLGVTHATSTTNTWTAQFVGWGSMN